MPTRRAPPTTPTGWTPGATETRRAPIAARSLDREARTVEAVLATGHRVLRWFGYEQLGMTADAVDLGRVRTGRMTLLFNHDANRPVGIVETAQVQNGALVGRLRFAQTPEGEAAMGQVERGELGSISVGYRVSRLVLSEIGEDDDDVYLAARWELLEASLVTIPADPSAAVRSTEGGQVMPQPVTQTADDTGGETLTRAERRRITAIRDLGERAGMPREAIEDAIERETPIEAFRVTAFDFMAERDASHGARSSLPPSGVPGGPAAGGYAVPDATFDNPQFLGRAVEDALFARMTGRAPEGAAAELAGLSLLQLGERVVAARGERVSWRNRDAVVDAMLARTTGPSARPASWLSRRDALGGLHGTSDFPTLLQGAGSRVLADAYRAAESPLKALGRRRTASDFRALTRVQLGEAPQLTKVNESGEVTRGSMAESKESFRVETFARIFGLSRQAIINDDLGAFADLAVAWGQAAASLEADVLAALVAGVGVVTDDGHPLFHTSHRNVAGTGGALSVSTLGEARRAMREQVGLDGKTPISVVPRHLVVGPALETVGEQVLADLAAATVDSVNPFAGRLTLHVEPRLSGTSWRLFADPAALAAIEFAYLGGAEGPQVATREGWDVLGAEFRAVLDFGAGPGDWRAAFYNAGV